MSREGGNFFPEEGPKEPVPEESVPDQESGKEFDVDAVIREKGEGIYDELQNIPSVYHTEIALKFLGGERPWLVGANLAGFTGLDRDVAMKLIRYGQSGEVADNLARFTGLDREVAWQLIEAGHGYPVVYHLDRFLDLDPNDVATKFIEEGDIEAVIYNLDRLNLDHKVVALKLIEEGEREQNFLLKNLDRFQNLDRDVALKLIEAGHIDSVCDDPSVFGSVTFDNSFAVSALERVLPGNVFVDTVVEKLHPEPGPDSIAAIYFDASVPKEIRRAKETYGEWITPEYQRSRMTHAMTPTEYRHELIVENRPELAESIEPLRDAYKAVLETYAGATGEAEEAMLHMRRFGDDFGPEVAMRFANRPDLERHDAYLAAQKVASFLSVQPESPHESGEYEPELSALRKKFSRVLLEVAKDNSTYENVGTAHHEFNRIMDGMMFTEIRDLLVRVEELQVPALVARAAKLRESQFDPLQSWKGLKEASALQEFLGSKEVCEALQSPELPVAVREYAGKLMEHPNVSMAALTRFLTQPSAFLDATANFVDESLQRSMAPARMADIERLGLTAAELRDALADGTIDRLQVLPPDEGHYRFDSNGGDLYGEESLRAGFSRGVGSRSSSIKGEAKNPMGLFNALAKWGKDAGLSKEECGAWIRGERGLPVGADPKALADILYDQRLGMAEPKKSIDVRVRIGRKDDPGMIVAGNDTSSCMPFGDGKTNVYSWGPGFSQLVVERKNEKGEWRTMAQSVLSLDFDAGRPAPEVIGALRSGQAMREVVSADAFAKPPKLVCDNIEPSPNDIAEGRGRVIERAYAAFMRSYLEKHAETLGIDPTEVIVGREEYLAQDRWTFPKVANTFVPLAPLSYTDNAGESAYSIRTGLAPKADRKIEEISTMRPTDIMPAAFLESKNYADNPGLTFGLFDRQHKIIGAAIAAEKNGDPKLSVISRDAKGLPVGYMIAYMDRTTDVPEVFIDDMAVDRSRNILAARHAIKLLDSFLDRYVSHYQDSGAPFPPIYAQMRETTSYRLLTRQAEAIAKKRSLAVEISEEGETTLGGETLKLVRIFVGNDQAAVEVSKERFAARRVKERPERPDGDDW